MKKVSEVLKGVYDFSYVKKCIHCGKKVKEYKTYYSDDKKVKLIRPIFNCDCIEKAQQEKVEKEKKNIILDLMRDSNLNKYFLNKNYTIANKGLKEYYDNMLWIKIGISLLIYGKWGRCKTGDIHLIAEKAIREFQYSILYFNTSEFPKKYMENKSILKKAERCDLLILDNFAKEESEKFGGIIFDLLDNRIHKYKKSNALIINFEDDSNVTKIYQAPMSSRLLGFKHIKIEGRDRREDIIYGENQ